MIKRSDDFWWTASWFSFAFHVLFSSLHTRCILPSARSFGAPFLACTSADFTLHTHVFSTFEWYERFAVSDGERILRLSKCALRCVSCHWEISQFLLALPLWSVLWHYTGWIDVHVCVCQCFKNQDSFECFPCFWLALGLSFFRTFHWGSCSISTRRRTLFRFCRYRLACDLGTRHLVDARMARAGEGKDLMSA